MLTILNSRPSYLAVRLSLSLLIIYTTGMRISELRMVTFKTVKTLGAREGGYLAAAPLKSRGKPKRTKAWLSRDGQRLGNQYKHLRSDLRKYLPDDNAFIACSLKNPYEPVSRAHFTKAMNGFIKPFGEGRGLVFTSHSFRKTRRAKAPIYDQVF